MFWQLYYFLLSLSLSLSTVVLGTLFHSLLLAFLLVVFLEPIDHIFLNPARRAQCQSNAQWHRKSSKINERKGFRTQLRNVFLVGKIWPVSGEENCQYAALKCRRATEIHRHFLPSHFSVSYNDTEK